MSRFKVGDKVRRTSCPGCGIVVGGVYTVSSCREGTFDQSIDLKEFKDGPYGWSSVFFELADDPNVVKPGDLVKHKRLSLESTVYFIDEKVVVLDYQGADYGYVRATFAIKRDDFDQFYVKVPAKPPVELKVGDKFRYDNAGQDHLIDGEHADQWIIKTRFGNYNFKAKKDLAQRLAAGTLTIVTSEKN